MGFTFVSYMFLSNNPSSGVINSSNLSCLSGDCDNTIQKLTYMLFKKKTFLKVFIVIR